MLLSLLKLLLLTLLLLLVRLAHNQLLRNGLVVGRHRRMDDRLLDNLRLLTRPRLQLLNVQLLQLLLRSGLTRLLPSKLRLRQRTLDHHLLLLSRLALLLQNLLRPTLQLLLLLLL